MTVSPARPAESLWPARIAILIVIALQVTLYDRLTAGPNWLLPFLEAALLPLTIVRYAHLRQVARLEGGRLGWLPSHGAARVMAFGLIMLLNLANLVSLLLLVQALLPCSRATGRMLLLNALNIWSTNLIVYTLWYWGLDRGGPAKRRAGQERSPDMYFAQTGMPDGAGPWQPSFIDYLFVSFTNATAFSPTDTLPLTPTAKVLMMIQASTSLLTLALVASRAVNILG